MAAVQSAVRLPTPPPPDAVAPTSSKRKRSPSSRSPSPNRRRTPPAPSAAKDRAEDRAEDEDEITFRGRGFRGPFGMRPKALEPGQELSAEDKLAAAKAEYDKLLNSRAGGVYIPPARLRALEAQLVQDKTSKEYQRIAWEALKKSLQGLVNKATAANIKLIVPELFGENLIRGKGLFCRAIMRAQAASLPFTSVYAAMVAIVNTKIPEIGELLLHRLVSQFKKAFKRNDKAVCLASTTFIGGLFNQQVAHEIIVAEILLLLLQNPTDDSVEIAVGLMREVGEHLTEMNGQIAMVCFDRFRTILHEHDLDKRVQYMIEVLFQVRKDDWKNHEAIKEELDLVEEEDQITHVEMHLDQEHDTKDSLNVFRFDAEFEENEQAYKKLKAEILGDDSGSEAGSDSGSEASSSDEEAENAEEKKMEIQDQSNAELVALRKRIYLTIQSSADFEECVHKLMRINLPAGMEPELPSMVIECCSQATTYVKFYGLIGERLARLNRTWQGLFEECFDKYYSTIHRYETNKLRNIARFFGHMLGSDALAWDALAAVHLNEDETTSSSRIFIKILFQDLQESLGMPNLVARTREDVLQPSLAGIFPGPDSPRNLRFAINYFTSIGMGALTEDMRGRLKAVPKPAPPALAAAAAARGRSASSSSGSYSSSYSSYTGSSRSRSRSPPPRRDRQRPGSRSPPPRRRGRSPSSGGSSSRSYSSSRSRTPPRRRAASPARGRDRSPPPQPPLPQDKGRPSRREPSASASRSPPPRRGARRARSKSPLSRSRSPPPRKRVPAATAAARSRSRTPPRRR